MKRISRIALCAVVFAQAGCSGAKIASSVGGFVSDAETGEPIEKALVVSSRAGKKASDRTSETGFYQVRALRSLFGSPKVDPEDLHVITFTAQGYETGIRRFGRIEGDMVALGFETQLPILPNSLNIRLRRTESEAPERSKGSR